MAKKDDKQAQDVFETQDESAETFNAAEEPEENGSSAEEAEPVAKQEEQKAESRRPKAKTVKGKPPPYVGANDVSKKNLENAKFQNLHVKDESIVAPPGHSQYFCKYNCANGKYVRGRAYLLRDDDPLVLAKDKHGRGKFFKKL